MMHQQIEEVSISRIRRKEALGLRNEISKATQGRMYVPNEYPCLKELYTLLTNAFESSINGVHFDDRSET